MVFFDVKTRYNIIVFLLLLTRVILLVLHLIYVIFERVGAARAASYGALDAMFAQEFVELS